VSDTVFRNPEISLAHSLSWPAPRPGRPVLARCLRKRLYPHARTV